MTKRTSASFTLALALLAPGLAAQEATTQQRPPQVDVLASAVDAISRMHLEEFSDSVLWQAAAEGMVGAITERYASLFQRQEAASWEDVLTGAVATLSSADVEPVQESEQWEEETTGNYSGIGLQITLLNDEITVTAVFRGFPADHHGISVGDVIVGVNEHDATDWGTDMAADSIRGPVGTDVDVHIKRLGYEDAISYSITRAEVHVPAVDWGVLEGGIGYVVMDRVARNAAREMSEALAELDDHKGLIIDLRRNPGGFLTESLMLADLFLEQGSTLASTEQRIPGSVGAGASEKQSFEDQWEQMAPDLPIVVLVDEFTASGAEILAGALQDYDRAIVVGERSFGKGVVQTVMELPHNRRLRFTTGTWHTPLGRSLQRARDSRGQPLEENLAALPRVKTGEGRALIDGGGIFPDVEIADDTLRLSEQKLLRTAAEQQFPLALRIAELGFNVAAERRAAGEPPGLPDSELEQFVAQLIEEGLPAELLQDPEVVEYLRWRGKMMVAQRMNDVAAEADFRTERDPVLREAIRLLQNTTSPHELLEAVGTRSQAAGRGSVGVGH
jgi:carboxyl-terminal processing protease